MPGQMAPSMCVGSANAPVAINAGSAGARVPAVHQRQLARHGGSSELIFDSQHVRKGTASDKKVSGKGKCALGYHSVLATGLMHLHGITREKNHMLNDDTDDTMLATSEFIESEGSIELYRKTLRIKAKKSLDWVRDTTSCYKLLLSALVISPMERIMYTFMKWQRTQAFLSKTSPPAVLMANPSRSPACAAMPQLCGQMQTGRLMPDVADSTALVELAHGLPATTPDDFIRQGFWCYVRGVGELWHRLHLPYTRLPWHLARLLDTTIDESRLSELASWFVKLPTCCLNDWFGHAVRAHVSDETDLLPRGKCQTLLRGLYNCKTFNIEVENNFARMQSMKRVGRGRLDLAHNLASKHVLAEAKLAHVRELTRCDAPDPGLRQHKTFNGYTLFWSAEMQKRVCLPGETAEQCRVRVMNECKQQWLANPALRETYSFQAKIKNQQARTSANRQVALAAATSQNGPHEVDEGDNDDDGHMDTEVVQQPQDRTGGALVPHKKIDVEYVQPLALSGGYGCFGIGDRRFGINKKLVQDADDSSQGFVQKGSREWREYAGGVCGEKPCSSGSIYPGCLDVYGFCCKTIASMPNYEMVLDQLQAMVRNHRRPHVSVKGKKTTNFGPDSAIDHPFLVAPDIGRQPADDSTNQNPPPVGKVQRSMRTMMTPCAKAPPLFCEYQRRLHEAEEFKRQADIQMSHGYGRAVTIDDPVFENYRRQLLWRVNSPYAKRTLELVSSDPRLAPVAKDGPASPAPPQIDSSVSHQVMDDLAPVQHSDIDHAHDHNEEDYDLYSEFGLVDLLPVAANESGAGLVEAIHKVVDLGEISLELPSQDDACWMKVGSDQFVDGDEAEEEATDQTVWTQGGYEAEYGSEAKYQAAVQQDPTINHGFLVLRNHVVRMKQEDPNCKFRLERVAPTIKEQVKASQSRQQGLEKPETHFVLLANYTEEFGKPEPSQIVYEVIDGVSVPGVDVLTGRAGWHKRVNRDMCDVTKTAELTDVNIDPTGQAAERIFHASKKQLTKSYAALCDFGESVRMEDADANTDVGTDETAPANEVANIDGSDSDDDGVPSFMALLKTRYSSNPATEAKGKTAKPSATQAATKPKPASASTSRNKAADENAPVGISNANRKRRRTDVMDEGVPKVETAVGPPLKKGSKQTFGEDDDADPAAIAATDQEVIDQFESKIALLKAIDPPNDDANFKEYMDDHLQKVNAIITELRTKKKSVGRRKHHQGEMLLTVLAEVETKLKSLVVLNKRILSGITGATPLASTSSLLDVLQEATDQDGFQFGSTVTRRALKALVADDIKVGRWTALVDSTYRVIREVLQTTDDVDADEFFYMSCSQAMAKLVKGTMGKIKNKDP
eukprot:s1213_g11.t2